MTKLILAGGGHGHINILKEIRNKDLSGLEITLITDFARQYYSGMLPGFIEGIYTEEEISFDVEDLCKKAGVKYIHEKILEIDGDRKLLITDKNTYDYDFISMNLGSLSREEFEINPNNSTYVKPIARIVDFKGKLDQTFKENPKDKKKLVIVGGGASGVELSLSIATAYPNLDLEIFTKNSQLLPIFNQKSREKLDLINENKKIRAYTGERVLEIKDDRIITDKREATYDFLIVSTGFKGPEIKYTGFEKTEDNYLLVDDNLKANETAIAMGDMVTIKSYPKTPKAGVFAIRQAPILYQNLMKMIKGEKDLISYKPQTKYLQVLNCGEKKALLNYSKAAFYGSLSWRLKDYIDRKYMEK